MLNKLVECYLQETHHTEKLSEEEARRYYGRLLDQDRINYVLDQDELAGYLESFRLTCRQLTRMCAIGFSIFEENITRGNILYVNNLWTRHQDRHSIVKQVTAELIDCNKDFKMVAWHRYFKDKEIRLMNRTQALRIWGIEI